jgi:hypothetical protein
VIDWFTMLLFSGSGLLIWLFWLAGVAGWPPEIVARLEKSIPQFQLTFAPIHFLVAMMASIAWLWLVMWRTGRHRDSLWKSLALPAGGAATCWILLTSLWLPYLNQTRSMAELGNQLKTSLPLNSCVIAWNLNNEQISALYYYGKISHLTTVTDISSDEKCSLLLANYNSLQLNNEAIDNNVWIQSELLIGNRLNNDDDLMIFHRR